MSKTPYVIVGLNGKSWGASASEVIECAIRESIVDRGICSVMLNGGNTARYLYDHWTETPVLPLEHIRFFFGDERCVPPDHPDSNYALAMRTFLANGFPPGCLLKRMEADNSDREAAAKAYEELLPESIDVLLLGMGTDGHIASLFPRSSALRENQRSVVCVHAPKFPHDRLTITPKVIANARSVFLLATGREKGKVLADAIASPSDFMSLPVRLAMSGTWLLDAEAGDQLKGY